MKFILKTILLFLFIIIGNFTFAQGTDLQLAQQYYLQGDFEKAVIYYEKVYSKEPNHANFTRYFECLLKTNNLKDAEKTIKKQMDKYPNNIDYDFQYADFLTQNNRSKEADKIYTNLIKQKAGNSQLILDLFNSFKDINRLDYAKQTLDIGRKTFGYNLLLNLQYAELYYLEKNYAKMMDEYLDFIELAPSRISEAQDKLSTLMQENDDNNSFLDVVKDKILIRTQKGRADFIYDDLLIWFFAQRKQFNIALTQVQALDKRENGQGKRVYELGKICLQNKDYRVASKAFKYVSEIKDSYLQADAKKALLSVRYLEITEDKNYDASSLQALIQEYNQVLQANPNNRVNYNLLMQLATIEAYYANHTQKAVAILKDLIATSGLTSIQLAEAKILLADIYVLTNEIW
jgi:tetratricopeptide (TPR) repeat protein